MRVLFLGAPVSSIDDVVGDHRKKFEMSGANSGNLLIGDGLRKEIKYTSFGTYGSVYTKSGAEIDSLYDLIAIPAANFIYKGFDFGYLADLIEKTTLPCLMVGVGAQFPSKESFLDVTQISIGTVRLLRIVSERSKLIGTRGAFTSDILGKLGIHNTQVTGCPSIYSRLKSEIKVNKKSIAGKLNVSVNGSRNVYEHSYSPENSKLVESSLIQYAINNSCDYVLQNEQPEMHLIYDDVNDAYMNDVKAIIRRLDLKIDEMQYIDFFRKHGKIFYDLDVWSDYIKAKDFSIGTRFHGNVMAIVNSVPSVIITHDSRTIEMSNFIKIPNISLEKYLELNGNIEKIYEHADFTEFEQNYKKIFNDYLYFMNVNNIPTNFTV